ncbi:MAG: alpha/beta fold hydrolase, partial [Oscillospiraceae bacterium]
MRIILIHGLGQTAAAWDGVTSRLPLGYTISAPELAGFASGDCTYDSLYRGFCGYCGSFSEPLLLCGLSLGAVLALNYAADFPERVSGLVLIAPQFKMPQAMLKLQSAVFHIMPQGAFKGMGFTKCGVIELTGSMARLDFTDSLSRITCPVTIACGVKDKTNMKAARELFRLLPGSELRQHRIIIVVRLRRQIFRQ